MTEDKSADKGTQEPNTEDMLVKLRDETQAQIKALKEAFTAQQEADKAMIAELKEQNESLQRALVRSAVSEPPTQEEKSEEQLYKEKVEALAQKTREYMKNAH